MPCCRPTRRRWRACSRCCGACRPSPTPPRSRPTCPTRRSCAAGPSPPCATCSAASAGRQPLVLYIDDLQWGDADSAALLSDLLAPPDPPPLLLLCCYRSEYGDTSPCLRALREQPGRRELEVEALSEDDAHRLALDLLGRDDPAARAQAALMARESGGSPYFLQALAQSYLEGADVTRLGTLDEVLWRRATRAARAGAASAGSGQRRRPAAAPGRRAAGGAGRPGGTARRWRRCASAISCAAPARPTPTRSRRTTTASARRCWPIWRRPRGSDYHRRLAEALEGSGHGDAETLAVHFRGADERDKAGRYYAEAARQAADALAFDRAAGLYRLALELRPGEGDEARDLHAPAWARRWPTPAAAPRRPLPTRRPRPAPRRRGRSTCAAAPPTSTASAAD